MQIFVKTPTDQTLELDVLPSDTVKELKQKIRDRDESSFYGISFKGNKLDNSSRLSDIGIENGSTWIKNGCTLCCFISIFVKNALNGKIINFQTSPFNTCEDVKHLIENSEGLQLRLQRLNFDGKLLEDHRKLSSYNIQHESTLHLRPRI
ncbi:ubiquitin-related domain-containing protein [Gigaspora rosea]|uniref:Ubiquitin-related domain-containing protein n=1 Tax=Gigaspora rosea TaxID=44941 RepID=A0A397U2P6_9GLOM|nr:ubiquitin-related domain-containing protein [Gigaspora rosea]